MTHIIHKQELQLITDSLDKTPDIQESYRQAYWNKLLPRLDEIFTEINRTDLIWRVERLELDLGILPPEGFEETLLNRLESQLRHQLLQMKLDLEQGFGKKHQMSIIKSENWELEVVLSFLNDGQIPWWLPKAAKSSFSQIALKALDEKPEMIIHTLRKDTSSNLAKRLLKQMSPAFLTKLIGSIKEGAFFKSIKKELKVLLSKSEDASGLTNESGIFEVYHKWVIEHGILEEKSQTQAIKILIKELEIKAKKQNKRGFTLESLKKIKTKIPILFEWFERTYISSSKKLELPSTSFKSKDQSFNTKNEELKSDHSKQLLPTNKKYSKNPEANSFINSKTNIQLLQNRKSQHPYSKKQLPATREIDPEILAEGIHLENAGLVLIAPFLGGFFRKTNLMKGRAFPSEEQNERAILLTQYLVNEETIHPEYNLILNKLLCGWPLRKTLEKEFSPLTLEKAEVTDLLESAIQHWEALGNTKVWGFRTSFLQRPGKLSLQQEGYHLLVERKGVDVLLEKLPWTIGFIRLAWMERPLTVEW